ncbi:GDNF family receptor alpha-4-like [Asterias amurensis]|uniref:GDNF family receptor alpha-4-like n=1 Tax=Asterias amurensis TaxID=7602 RepID=UPI003AB15870
MDTLHLTVLPIVIWILTTPCGAADCLYAQQKCNENRTCAIMLTMVPQLCGNSSSDTTCQAPEPSQCDSILEILTQSKVFEGCQCDPFQPYFAECDRVYRMVFKQQCTASRDQTSLDLPTETQQTKQDYIPLYTWQFLTATEHEEVPPTGGIQTGESTCVQALDSCTGDVTCRKLLAEYLSQCSKDRLTNTCRTTQCRTSIRFFLDHVSPIYTHALLYCYCTSTDSQCEVLRRGLNADCANKGGEVIPNCLELSDQCSASTLCSTNFENYKKHCAISDTSGTGCARSYGECRNARLGILGTVVAATCTCVGSEGSVATRCKQQQHTVSDNSCFLRASYAYYSPADNVEVVHTTQMSRLRINKRVNSNQGCDVKLGSGSHDVYVRAGNVIRIPDEHIADCTQICRCLSSGFLSECFSVLCNVTTCRKDTSLGSDAQKECVWSGCERICIDTQPKLLSRSPGLLLAYSVMEAELIRHQLHVELNISVIKEKLHQLLASINTQNPCQLEYTSGAAETNGTIAVFAHSKHLQEWECLNQLVDLASLINYRAPSVATDVVMSMVKIASVVEPGVSPVTTNSRSCGVWYHHQLDKKYLFYLFIILTLILWVSV